MLNTDSGHASVLQPDGETPRGGGLRWLVRCPKCGEENIDRAETGPHQSVTMHPDRDEYDSPTGTRGGYVQVELTCSGGHDFRLFLANHKGMEYIDIIAGEGRPAAPVDPENPWGDAV
ncbi:hypothetical protein [Nonomuraea sp. NPDC049784]|uniref:hypothetical protein n=1 Tax=Nonomuraea sp. NPDC049784 TaxID=3154361 RepID=UPI0033E19255